MRCRCACPKSASGTCSPTTVRTGMTRAGCAVWCWRSATSPNGWERELALREADRRKDEFLATLAHELRNPLAPILNSVQLLDGDTPLRANARLDHRPPGAAYGAAGG